MRIQSDIPYFHVNKGSGIGSVSHEYGAVMPCYIPANFEEVTSETIDKVENKYLM